MLKILKIIGAVNKLLNDDTCKSDTFICCDPDLEVSNKCNDYISEVGSIDPTKDYNLSKIINPVSNNDQYIYLIPIPSSHFFKPTSVSEIIHIIDTFKNSFTCYYQSPGGLCDNYDISMHFIKLIGNYIVIPLTYLLNKCITIGYFPNYLKIARVIVIHKRGKIDHVGNYKPISLIPQISKILEFFLEQRLLSYINKHNMLIDNQFDFKVSRSTPNTVDCLMDSISNKLDNKYK